VFAENVWKFVPISPRVDLRSRLRLRDIFLLQKKCREREKLVLQKKKDSIHGVYGDYSKPNVSDVIVTILQSYIGYIKNKNYPEF
jgi:hypothetical protein